MTAFNPEKVVINDDIARDVMHQTTELGTFSALPLARCLVPRRTKVGRPVMARHWAIGSAMNELCTSCRDSLDHSTD